MAADQVKGAAGTATGHDSAALHVTGAARYTDDRPEARDLLYAAIGMSSHAHARLAAVNLARVRAAPGVITVLTAADIPGHNNYGGIIADDPIFADGVVSYAGQAIFAAAATSTAAARRAVQLADIDYDAQPALLDPRAALAAKSFVLPSRTIERGHPDEAIEAAPHRLSGSVYLGGQDQFYLEGQIAVAVPGENRELYLHCSTQHPAEVQHLVAHALGRDAKDITVECRRMGGAFGGKESQPALIASIAALLAVTAGQPVKLRLDRDVDMMLTGKRHDTDIEYEVGFDERGRIRGIRFEFAVRCGMSADLSGPICDRMMFHSDNTYYLEHVRITSHRLKTHTVSNTAFRGFGGPQGMFAIEQVLDEIARHLGLDPLDVRTCNLYSEAPRNITPYGQTVEDNIAPQIMARLAASAEYRRRRRALRAYNREHPVLKRGLALTPVKFGISFTATHLNQAGALLHIYNDGSVQLNHGGTEMGQGLYTKVAQVVASELCIDMDRIQITAADTGKVPNTSATAASSSSDLNGMAARIAAQTLKERLLEFAAGHFDVPANIIEFRPNEVAIGNRILPFAELTHLAYMARIPLSASGYYRTPKIHYDRETLTGRPFFYYAYGAAVSEVMIDTLTGEHRVLRVDILHDCGESLNPAIDLGQIEGGFVQGMGWLTTEELYWTHAGHLATHAPSTYKIPTCSDVPADFRVELLEAAPNREETVYRSKAVGEPPLMLALSVWHAIKDAVASVGQGGASPRLDAPATPEQVLLAVDELRARRPVQ